VFDEGEIDCSFNSLIVDAEAMCFPPGVFGRAPAHYLSNPQSRLQLWPLKKTGRCNG
jgi:hypothetical protein